ncbi:type II toxin-antitoxin system VapC family toxin [Nostoc sp.]|uniref:type II toxin-antitoxin system VapC family toxin n=1 Tax=Nostoc sp. TaxID=1180 RepID=UPI002FFC20F9
MIWILDTDHVSLFQQRHPVVTQRINAVNREDIAVTIITVEEQLRGRFNVIRKASSSDTLVLAYANLRLP